MSGEALTRAERERAERVLARLGELDPRFAAPAVDHELDTARSRGVTALPALMDVAEDATRVEDERLAHLDAVFDIVSLGAADETTLVRLGRLGAGSEPSALVRGAAARALMRTGHEGFVQAFEQALASSEPRAVAAAARAMGYARRRKAVPLLLELLVRTNDEQVRTDVVWALGEIADATAVDTLIEGLERGLPVTTTLEALGKLGDPGALPVLAKRLEEGGVETRRAAAQALHRLITANEIAADTWLDFARDRARRDLDPIVQIVLCSLLHRKGAPLPTEVLEQLVGEKVTPQSARGYLALVLQRTERSRR